MNLRDPEALEPGLLAWAQNLRCDDGRPATRRGVVKPVWCHRTFEGDLQVHAWSTPYGAGVFQDPNSRWWIFIASALGVYRMCENNGPQQVPLPGGVKLTGPCTFAQAFNKLYLLRGRYQRPLVYAGAAAGFEDVVDHWSATVDYAEGDRVAWGPWVTLTSVTGSGNVATVVSTTDHGLTTGQDIVMKGAGTGAYNGRFTVTVLDPVTFTYEFSGGGAAGGTPTCSLMNAFWEATSNPVIGNEPGLAGVWTRRHDVLPNAASALYTNNRLLVPTAWTPGDSSFDSTSSYTKTDFLVATDVLDEQRFDWANAFRINQGGDDEIQDLVKFGGDSVLVFKDRSWGVLSGLATNLTGLSGVSLDMRGREHGLLCRGAVTAAGGDVIFLSAAHGVVSLRLSEEGKARAVDVPLSYPIEPLIHRIDWATAKTTARLAYWNNKLYMAVPLHDVPRIEPELVADGAMFDGPVSVYLVPGQTYHYVPGNAVYLSSHSSGGSPAFPQGETITLESDFVASKPEYYLWGTTNVAVGSSIKRVLPQGVNNVLLVYDFLTRQWVSVDTGEAMCVQEFITAAQAGKERLYYLGADGYVNLLEESFAGDEVAESTALNARALRWQEVETTWRTRYYFGELATWLQSVEGRMMLGTWHSKFSVTLRFEGALNSKVICTDREPSQTNYRTWGVADWVTSNVNDDHATVGREDYAVMFPGGIVVPNLYLGANGFAVDLVQETPQQFYAGVPQARAVQVEVVNTQGRIELRNVTMETARGRDRKGILE